MPGLPVAALKCVMYGNIEAIQDWSTSIWLDVGNGPAPTQPQLDTVAAEIAAQFFTAAELYSAHWGMTLHAQGVNVYYYASGAIHSSALSNAPFSSVINGASGSPGPSFIAQVASLRTSDPSRSGRGRMYWPLNDLASYNSDHTTNLAASDLSTAVAALIHSLNGVTVPFAGEIAQCVVASFTKGRTAAITNVKVGNKYEVQRRRNDQFNDTIVYDTPVT